MNRETQLGELLLQWEERGQQGETVAADDLCENSPELREDLHQRIEALKAMAPVLALTPPPTASTVMDGASGLEQRELPAVPGYEVLYELGHGGMGVVYKVRNKSLDRPEALKMIRSRVAPGPQIIQRFQVEIRAAAQFQHERIVRNYDAREHDGQPYFTMEYVSSGNLGEHLGRFQADRKAAVRLLAKVARAVHFLHTNGIKKIIHRDLKPGNILLKEKDEPVVSDFGLVKFFDRPEPAESTAAPSDSQLTQVGAVLGTVHYMSPEQAAGKIDRLTAATDIWALGVMLYELLTGRRPFVGKDNDEIRQAILKGEFKRTRQLQPKIDKHLDHICSTCLKTDPEQRYQSADALAIHLERWLDGYPIVPESWPIRIWRKVRRYPRVLIGSLAVVFIFAVFMYLSHPNRVLERTERHLKGGKKVTVIGERGRPGWYKWRTLEGTKNVWHGADGAFCVQSWEHGLLELVRDPQRESFLFSAEVRHDHSSPPDGAVGLYFMYSNKATESGLEHAYTCLAFDDLSRPDAQLLLLHLHREPDRYRTNCVLAEPKPFEPARKDNGMGPWRLIAVKVSPARIQAYWDGQLLYDIPRAEFDDSARAWLRLAGDKLSFAPDFRPRGGLGLYVFRGTAAFRRVTVEPL